MTDPSSKIPLKHQKYGGKIPDLLASLFSSVQSFVNHVAKHTHQEGYFYIFVCVVLTALFFLVSTLLGAVFFAVTVWCIAFFRDPDRVAPADASSIVAPADGIISDISEVMPPPELSLEDMGLMTRISIFLNVFNVHVNRIPLSAKVLRVVYHPGKFLNASLDKASEENERNTMLLDAGGHRIILVQIAGLIARRIICYAKHDQVFETGERYGIIKFGSRVDIYLPREFKVLVRKGQIMVGGETVISTAIPPSSIVVSDDV